MMDDGGDVRVGAARKIDPRPTLDELSQRLTDAHARGAAPDFPLAPPMDWIMAIDKLLVGGRIEVARSALAWMRERQPELKWADSVFKLIDLLPEEVERAPRFRDDVDSDVQLVERPGSKLVIFAFCGRKQHIGMPLWLFQRWLSRLRAHVVYLRDFDNNHFLGGVRSLGSQEATVIAMDHLVSKLGVERVLCLGNSSGGYGAMLYGLRIGAEKVLSFSGASSLDPAFNLHLNRAEAAIAVKQAYPDARLDLREAYLGASRPPRTLLVYGAQAWDDRIHAEHMAGAPGIELLPVDDYKGHGTVAELVHRGRFGALLDDLAAPSAPAPTAGRNPMAGAGSSRIATGGFDSRPAPSGDDSAAAFEPIPASALEASVTDRFELVAERFANRLAVQDEHRALTYAQLRARVAAIAAAVASATQGRDGPVAVLARHDAGFAAAFLGVMAAGRAAVLLDSGHPAERNRRIATHSGACAVAAAPELEAYARDIFPAGAPIIDLDAPAADPQPALPKVGPDDLAYVLYTSGSTGEPKGVAQDHRGAVHGILTFTEFARIRPDDRLCIFYSGVIASVRRTLGALLNGASLHILPAEALGAAGIAREVQARGITIIVDVPTLFRRLAGALAGGERLERLRFLCLSGDRCGWSDYDAFLRVAAPGAEFGISAASTEVASGYARWIVDPGVRTADGRLPVGRPIRDVDIWIEGDDGQPAPDGEVGEVVVSSRYVARGYWRDPDATAARFQPDPRDELARVYRTGDVGLRRPDGLFELVGRKDRQIKLRGHRIEPAEVEGVMRSFEGVADAATVVRRDAAGVNRALVAYVELKPGYESLMPRHLMAKIAHVMPRHLTPSVIFVVKALPRLMNFKVDGAALAKLDARRARRDGGRAEDPVLDRVARVFEAIVPGAHATPDDNLLSLGGDSLQAVELALELGRAFDVEIPGAVLKHSQSIRQLSAWITGRLGRFPAP